MGRNKHETKSSDEMEEIISKSKVYVGSQFRNRTLRLFLHSRYRDIKFSVLKQAKLLSNFIK